MPKLAGLVLGVLVFRTASAYCRDTWRITVGMTASAALGAAAVLVGAVSALGGMDVLLPVGISSRGSGLDTAVHPNALAGLTLLVAPGLLVLLISPVAWRRGQLRRAQCHSPAWMHPIFLRCLVGGASAIMLVVLLMSRSRSGIAGLVFSLLFIWVLRSFSSEASRTVRVTSGIVFLAALAMTGLIVVAGGLSGMGTRVEIWSRALIMITAFPLTGVGLNAFRSLVPLTVPLQEVSPALDIAHAHNVFLQTALDVGILGLCAYLAMLAVRGESPAWHQDW